MKIHLPNSAYIGNIDFFLANFNDSQPDRLEVTANEKWISIHPVALSIIAALSLRVSPSKITCKPITAKSAHYLDRMGLNKFLGLELGSGVVEHESSGRFVPLTQIKTSDELTKFLTDIIPLLHLAETPKHAESIRYIISELVRNVLEHSNSKYGAVVSAQYFKKTPVEIINMYKSQKSQAPYVKWIQKSNQEWQEKKVDQKSKKQVEDWFK
ncbi:MAG: hypothetical protein AAB499_00820, partial [Patescibacteria group bacterium]